MSYYRHVAISLWKDISVTSFFIVLRVYKAWRTGLATLYCCLCLIDTNALPQGRAAGALDLGLSMSLFLPLQRRLREAVQLLEDYKHGTLRPGVTNEQVTLLEVGKEGRWQIHNLFPAARTITFPFSIHFYCGYRPLWTSSCLEGILRSFLYPEFGWKHGG